MNCRFCKTKLEKVFVDLGSSPPSNSFLKSEQLNGPETYFPLKIMVCHDCYLVQIDEFARHNDIFNNDYAYFSSFSTSWLTHAKQYTQKMITNYGISNNSLVVEIASNDGYLLQYFKEKSVPVLGIEPTANTAAVAINKGINTVVEFFGTGLAKKLGDENKKADLLLGNNVLAHVPDINDFVSGMKMVLKPTGIITMEFPHLLQLIDKNQFDTIYHEHFSYLSLISVKQIFEKQGLCIFDVEEIHTHGGSLRIYAKHQNDTTWSISNNVEVLIQKEIAFGLKEMETYTSFQKKAEMVKDNLLEFLLRVKKQGKTVVAYGAAAKGNTLLNYCGVKNDMVRFVSDTSPHKQNKYLPGVHIQVVSEKEIKNSKPNYVLILPWNLKDEISEQLKYVKKWDAQFVIAIPELTVF